MAETPEPSAVGDIPATIWRWDLGAKFGYQEEDPTSRAYSKPYVWTRYVLEPSTVGSAKAAVPLIPEQTLSNPPKDQPEVGVQGGLDQAVMALAESVGLIGPASRTDDLHASIQRFHGLIAVNASTPLTDKRAMMIGDRARDKFGGNHRAAAIYITRETERAHGITTASPAQSAPESEAVDAARPGPERPNSCKLTECQGKDRCRPCLQMDAAYDSPQSRVIAAVSLACDEAMAGATAAPSRGEWDEGFVVGIKTCVTVVRAAMAAKKGGA